MKQLALPLQNDPSADPAPRLDCQPPAHALPHRHQHTGHCHLPAPHGGD